MTALDRSLINAFHRPSPQSGPTVAEPAAAVPHVAVGPTVPLSRVLADLTATPTAPPENLCAPDQSLVGARRGARTVPVGHNYSPRTAVTPISAAREPSIATLLDAAFQSAAVAEPPAAVPHVTVGPAVPLSQALAELAATSATPQESPSSFDEPSADTGREPGRLHEAEETPQPMAVATTADPVGPSIAALLDQAFNATTAADPAEVSVAPSIAASASPVFQAISVTVSTPSAAEIHEIAPAETTTTAQAKEPTPAVLKTPAVTAISSVAEVDNVSSEPTQTSRHTLADSTPLSKNATVSPQPNPASWRPLLQVDRVIWPSIHNRLQTAAASAIEQMSAGLQSICASGSKVLGLASCASGEGVTTLLLAVARKLVSQGRKVVLVDANENNPQLAQNLGLLPQIGWEETLGGGLPLEEVVIESLADGLAVLPVREPSASAIAPGQIAASFDILAREFDIVLVDLGPLNQVEDEDCFSHDVAACMDAVVLVQNVRVTTPSRLAEVRQGLAASNLRLSGTIQNFVAG